MKALVDCDALEEALKALQEMKEHSMQLEGHGDVVAPPADASTARSAAADEARQLEDDDTEFFEDSRAMQLAKEEYFMPMAASCVITSYCR